jgi:methylated-DNA-[protein]-cysteine S-methyltransferase
MTYYTYMESPIGPLLLAGDDSGLRRIGFPEGKNPPQPAPEWQRDPQCLRYVAEQLDAYFAGSLRDFDLPLQMQGTPFQLSVWKALRDIPYGETISYGELARRIGNPKGSRAVGLANGANPIPIVVPCHRVIGSTGKLTGFGGGLRTKETLLALERNGAAIAGHTARRISWQPRKMNASMP